MILLTLSRDWAPASCQPSDQTELQERSSDLGAGPRRNEHWTGRCSMTISVFTIIVGVLVLAAALFFFRAVPRVRTYSTSEANGL